jgi:hypothetical protein
MLNLASRTKTLDELLGLSFAAIDIPSAIRNRAVRRYQEVANWLSEYWAYGNGGEIYPQGSFRLGTVVAPISADGEYDMDLVCRLDIKSASITQAELKTRVGDALRAYVATMPIGLPQLEEGKRCWTLTYPGEPFHMDVLPAIPDPSGTPNAIQLTDRAVVRWQPSNPIAYAEWFHEVMAREMLLLKEAAARALDIEDVPEDEIKTTLQLAVQALKRHRDIFFAHDPKLGPASIIVTTLAAKAYTGGGSLYEVLTDVTRKMPTKVDVVDGQWVVENPVCDDENFADRWNGHPEKANAFFGWMTRAANDFGAYERAEGADEILESVRKSLGDEPARVAAAKLGDQVRNRRATGLLSVGGAGTIGAASRRSVPAHTFHGDAPKHPHA